MELAIEIQDLVVEFTTRHGRMRAVDGLNLSVPRGHVFGFISKRAGKTTTIHALLIYCAVSRQPAGSGWRCPPGGGAPGRTYSSVRRFTVPVRAGVAVQYGALFNMSAAVARRRAGVLLGQVGLAEAATG